MNITVLRTAYTSESTTGIMALDGSYFGVTLEDTTCSKGIKIFGHTAIPAGRYVLTLSMSKRFVKILPELLLVPDFEGIRIHGGNSAANTEGCILVARERKGLDWIFGSLSDALVSKMLATVPPYFIEIINSYPYQWQGVA